MQEGNLIEDVNENELFAHYLRNCQTHDHAQMDVMVALVDHENHQHPNLEQQKHYTLSRCITDNTYIIIC
jgi:hypothetical protein